jgi:SAM-dependent methyltransferase
MLGLSSESHIATLDRLLGTSSPHATPATLFGDVSDDFWFWAFTEGYRRDPRLVEILPAFPSQDVQCRFTGASGDDTMREAFGFYSLVRRIARQHRQQPVTAILEFGCGWGRMIRLFLRDVEPQNLWGIDCMPAAIEICQSTNPYCRFQLVEPLPPSPIGQQTFDLVYAYSVFSHLSEDAHERWLGEFTRILRPGGLLVATTRPREFILACAEARRRHEDRDWAQGTVLAFPDTAGALERYDRGEFMYEPIGGGDVLDKSFFGETCIPRQYVERNWTRYFDLVDYIDDRTLCQQNVIVVRQRDVKA